MKSRLISRIPQFAQPGALASTTAFYCSIACFAISAACFGPTVPALAEQTGAALGEMGLMFFGGSLGYLIGSVFISRLYDRLPGHQLLGVSLLVIAACMAVVPLVPSLWLLALVVCIVGMAQGVINLGTNVMLLWIFGDDATPIINGMHFFFGIGAFLAPAIVAQAIIWGGAVRWAYWVLAVIIFIVALWVVTLRGSSSTLVQS
jgi:FHS family Na+ dependent glucose MFS transporter 1